MFLHTTFYNNVKIISCNFLMLVISRNANYNDFLYISIVSTSGFISLDGKVSAVIHVAASIYYRHVARQTSSQTFTEEGSIRSRICYDELNCT